MENKKTKVEIEYDNKRKYIYIWKGGDLVLCKEFERVFDTERENIEEIFGRKFKWK